MGASLTATEIWASPGSGVEEDLNAFGFRQSTAPSGNSIFTSHNSVLAVTFCESLTSREFLEAHGYGVACLWVDGVDATQAVERFVATGMEVDQLRHPFSGMLRPAVKIFGDVRIGIADSADRDSRVDADCQLVQSTDHFAVCVRPGRVDPVCGLLEQTLNFREIFRETIDVGEQSMISRVVQSPDGSLTLTIIEPGPGVAGQISQFLEKHNGEGVQHVAFRVSDAIRAVDNFAQAGVEFLRTPHSYYEGIDPGADFRHTVSDLEARGLLVDTDHHGALFQVFTKSGHPRGTLFYEVIERDGARTFGSGNIRALYEAVHRSQACLR